MRVFELHFNPPHLSSFLEKDDSPDSIFDSFCYQPENVYEKRLGSLFLVGELRNVLPHNLKFLDNLAAFLKKQYYSTPIKSLPETSLKESLKKTNEFLEEIAKKDDVSWLGNLNLAVLALIPRKNDWWEINFTKVGEVKILLLRINQIIDIGKNLEFSEIEPYPLKIFSNIVSGKLGENDIIAVLTKEVFDFFSAQNLLTEIAKIVPSSASTEKLKSGFVEKKLKEILKVKEKELLKLSGICFLCLVRKNDLSDEKKPKSSFTFGKKSQKFSAIQLFLPIFKGTLQGADFLQRFIKISYPAQFLKTLASKLPKKILNLISNNKLSAPLPKLSFRKISFSKLRIFLLSRKLILILSLLLFLLFGSFVFKAERTHQMKLARQELEEIKLKKIQAENFLILKDEKKASLLFKEAWEKILPQTKEPSPLKKEALSLKESIEENLFLLNKLEKITAPEIFFEIKKDEINFLPQKILFFLDNLYFFSPATLKFYKLSIKEKEGEILEVKRNVKWGASFHNSLLFFSDPNVLLFPKDSAWREIILQKPFADFNFDKFVVFNSNIYFLDKKSGEIIKYSLSPDRDYLLPDLWLSIQTKKPLEAKSMAIDGSIWVLTQDNKILRYYQGFLKENIPIDFFPPLKNPIKIWTSQFNSYLYILEPAQNRIIIIDKKGGIIKQFQSEQFDNLLDFTVSENGKTIWLLNGPKVYRLLF